MLPHVANGQQGNTGTLTISGEGPSEAGIYMLRLLKIFETRLGVPARIFYRVTTSVSATASITTDAAVQNATTTSQLQFAITEQPLSSAQRASFSGNAAVVGSSVHFPVYVNSYGLFYSVPGNRVTPLNITACLAARILTGDIQDWTHPDFLEKNPGFVKTGTDSYKITVLMDTTTSGSTLALLGWLAKACPSVLVTLGTIRTDAVAVGSNMITALQSTAFAFGYAMGSVGRAASVSEFAVETATAGQYLQTGSTNTTNMQAALAAALPTSLSGDYSTASAVSLSADRVAPILTVGYLVTKSDWSTEGPEEGQRGELVRALCAFFQSATVAGGSTGTSSALGLFADAGLLAMGPTLTAALNVSVTSVFVRHPAAVAFTLQDGIAPNVLSPTRSSFEVVAYLDVMTQLAALKKQLDVGASRTMRGVGSSAVSLFMWRVFGELKGRSTTPLHMVYRAAGSGAGQGEVVARDAKYQALVDFGASDTPMPDASFTELTNTAKVPIVHIPILLAPMNFFVNIPESALPSRKIKMSPCTIAKIMQADITSWSHADIAADNGGVALPDQPITVFYRQLSSGTTAVITEYLNRACAGTWRLGSGGLLSNWPPTFKPTASSANMSNSVFTTPWSIGYMDAANGLDLNLIEVAVRNKDGNYVTSQTGDVPAAASALFKSDAWPKSPLLSFASVSCLDQPGANTFPIVAMPFMFVRTDLTSRGDSGALLVAYLTFMLDTFAQNNVAPALGFAPLPTEVRQYTVERALPLLQVDTRSKPWVFESGSTLSAGKGGGDNVFSSFANSYENVNSQAFADFYHAYNIQQNLAGLKQSNASSSNTSTVATGTVLRIADGGAIQSQMEDLQKQIQILEAIAITGVVFGVVGLSVSLFTTCRLFVHASIWGTMYGGGGNKSNGSLVHPASLSLGGSSNNSGGGHMSGVRRAKSVSNLSDGSIDHNSNP
ncbi:hypothetical protein CHLRE_01g043250v5 [Chlamydomonas reinhardtii]|uniref:PBP domain-containing protein n=1 Tax=Chlamydomonas reinhardtii TaxID=3055 RepID=A0A2K3E7J3_CHLRE|nr:uncharacterized protein CHLRE_01g043250v5 [Chlamydomonas reinhardtii]PNW88758.1 hypothetical protein CHLRE_01g043250v5 [Chlamydomonas reinhardtii]